MARKQKPAIELASDIGWSAACLYAHGDVEADRALDFLWQANPRAFAWLSERLAVVAAIKARETLESGRIPPEGQA